MLAAVMGATGYTGRVLMRLLMEHPAVHSILPVSTSAAGEKVSRLDPGFGVHFSSKLPEDGCFVTRREALLRKPDAVFSALPAGDSALFCEPFFGKAVVFDLSADFRLKNSMNHESAYGCPAPFPSWRDNAVYGLTEVNPRKIAEADIIAVPGCYPTCVLLPLIPLVQAGHIAGHIVVNALSGISGAGKKPGEKTMFVERAESAVAYNPGRTHRHVPEMQQALEEYDYQYPLFFTPHLVPMRRGMEATICTSPLESSSEEDITHTLESFYRDSPFVQLIRHEIPDTRNVVGSNRCDIGWRIVDSPKGGKMLYIFSTIDNLMKGASGQAVQNMNVRFGLPETDGLPLMGEV